MEHYTYLAHYGIPKQQWGVRRFQNYDGSLTPEGRARYLGEPVSQKNKTVFVSGSSKTQDKSSGKTIAEIADIMGAPVSSIKDYLYEDFDSLR